jgi:MFS family permease
MRSAELARLIGGHICLHACMAGTRMAAPLLALRDGHSAMNVGVLLALFALAPVFLALPAGRFADRHGLRRPMGIAVTVAVLGTALAVAFPVFPVLCLSALMTGGATGAASICAAAPRGSCGGGIDRTQAGVQLAGDRPCGVELRRSAGRRPDDRLRGSGSGDTTGFRAAFLLMALLPLATWFWIRGVPELEPVRPVGGAPATRAWDLLREPMMRRLMLVNWCLSSCWDVHTVRGAGDRA